MEPMAAVALPVFQKLSQKHRATALYFVIINYKICKDLEMYGNFSNFSRD